tara:strand:- start:987 stop:1592 length:606 start_codon:yes stop_codon:yes gene_type:complete
MRLLLATLFTGFVLVSSQDSRPLTAEDGADFVSVMDLLNQAVPEVNEQEVENDSAREIVVTQRSLNGYLRFQGASILPEALSDVTVEILEGGQLIGTGFVNVDEVDDLSSGSMGMLQFLSGSLPVSVSMTIEVSGEELQMTLEDLEIGPVNVPPALAQLLVRQYSVNERYPNGIDLSEPILIPSAIEDVEIQQGRIVIVTQ